LTAASSDSKIVLLWRSVELINPSAAGKRFASHNKIFYRNRRKWLTVNVEGSIIQTLKQ
jgi:hypothetical protein